MGQASNLKKSNTTPSMKDRDDPLDQRCHSTTDDTLVLYELSYAPKQLVNRNAAEERLCFRRHVARLLDASRLGICGYRIQPYAA
ncbi:hypothetical protein LIER_32571 [Lithospermum erythrorhizon]|uniref:Uncharacterized protein n=1 Tax=Lithospermum erythrorhizon TaxID=34254 RepID=A0AAV3RU78_LITER